MSATLVETELTPAEHIVRLRFVDAELRRLEAEAAVLVAQIERDGTYRDDGHLTVAGFLRGDLRWSQSQVTARRRLARLVTELPVVVEHLAAGTIGVAQAHAFAHAAANPRCGDRLGEHVDLLLEHARVLPFQHFAIAINRWERLADTEGAHRDAEHQHDQRSLHLSLFDGVGRVDARCGALDFAEFSEIVERYRHAEFLADWEAATARYGEAAADSTLARTDTQRSWDALMRMALDAVSTPAGAQAPEPVVQIVCDISTFEAAAERAGLVPASGDGPEPVLAEMPFELRRCETTTGVPVAPADALIAAIHGRVRRVVFDSAGVVVDYGRLRRLFDGPARQAAMLHSVTCVFPGCNRPATWAQIDHLTDWQNGGVTALANSGPECPRHNRLKNSGFTVWRDPNGVYHTYAPDGHEIAAPPPPPATDPHRSDVA